KSKAAHLLPLGPAAWRLIEAQPRVGSDFVFGERWRAGFTRMKGRLDAIMKPVKPWQARGLRRTPRPLMSRAGVATEVAERMLCHLPNKLIRIYNVHDFESEKRAGFAALEREIDLIFNPPGPDVIPLRRP